jgi:hypothetical protein
MTFKAITAKLTFEDQAGGKTEVEYQLDPHKFTLQLPRPTLKGNEAFMPMNPSTLVIQGDVLPHLEMDGSDKEAE